MDNLEEVRITKLVHGGQGLAELPDGRKVFVWNALPGETVRVRLIKQKRSYAEAIAEEIVSSSKERIEPREANYLATSPWQIMTFEAEYAYKHDIIDELFQHEKVALPGFGATVHAGPEWQYRNKMEYSFWGDDDGLHLALHQRGSKGKQIVRGSALALPAVDAAANAILIQLQKLGVRAGDLKTIIVRANQGERAVVSLFVKPQQFPKLALPSEVHGLRVYHSNPKSPASVRTKLLYELGDCRLQDELLGKPFTYDVDSFFQVNIPAFEAALTRIKEHVNASEIVDMYAGVGTIGLSVATEKVELVELDPASSAMARINARANGEKATVTEASSEHAIQSIVSTTPVVFDPPRAGLHAKVVQRCLETIPPQIIYLSCNPATQARDLQMLQTAYKIEHFEIFNFFPRTPHIETLAVLIRS
ncbi:MAG TPA: TRAM domain-containing protein [Candidatus Saccharimonadales bacterium]|nr:TRAM domain-containing protein [Candidatus Saccharimonadales bacterium]